ncbi:hypothetical protein FB45DRAFT_1125561 [Roridomyces roridus]|uniref:F-box domain-containing protein n=1 Tax=Roridomyces roridus TaxID=1738132 RepID=A0AAD7C8A6_9AGAR|nr:hypothetical protein FB45DRAFT_1125561 [Roridomyces roridus]
MLAPELPTEILLKIFKQSIQSGAFESGGTTMAIAISQVCRAWRAVALDYPDIWRDVRLSSGSPLTKLTALVPRSQGGPISVAMDHRQTFPTSTVIHQWSLLNSLLPHRELICTLSVIAPMRILDLFSPMLFDSPHDWPRLSRLHVEQEDPSVTSQCGTRVNKNPVPRSANQPHSHLLRDRIPLWKIRFRRRRILAFECVSIAGITPTHLFIGLKELHVKESAYFVVAPHDTGTDGGVPSHCFREIQKLTIVSSPLPLFENSHSVNTKITSLTLSQLGPVDNPPGVLAHFLFVLRMPALEHLTIHHLHGHLHDEFVRWLAEANNPWPSLRSVDFESLVLDAQALRAFESVERLRIVDGDVQRILQILDGDPGLCPKVSEIDAGDEIGMPGRN